MPTEFAKSEVARASVADMAVMAIMNLTPDSFSGDGLTRFATAMARVRHLVDHGVLCIDIGAESTRPGNHPISSETEISRLSGVVEAIRKEFPQLHVSIDTRRSETAQAMLALGVQTINDVSGGLHDPAMFGVVAAAGCDYVLTSNGTYLADAAFDGISLSAPKRDNIVEIVKADLAARVELALAAGVQRTQLVVDPGVGFGRHPEDNLIIVRHVAEFAELGLPILLGVSRKSFIRRRFQDILPAGPKNNEASNETSLVPDGAIIRAASLTMACYAVEEGVDVIRTHDPIEFSAALLTMGMLRG